MTSTYRTGRARNRRQPDPGGQTSPVPVTWGTLAEDAGSVADNVVVEVSIYAKGNPAFIGADQVKETGLPSNTTLTAPDGSIIANPQVQVNASAGVTYTFTGTIPAGVYVFILGSQEPAVRGVLGEWLGSCGLPVTIA